jgi:hypothetical protein
MRTGWQQRKQEQWNNIYCGNPVFRPAIAAGWQIINTVTLLDGKRFQQVAECK